MTIFVLKTVLLLFLLMIVGGGVVVWLTPRLRLNFLLAIGLSFVLGTGIFAALVTTTILRGGFESVPAMTWGIAALGVLSIVAGVYVYRSTLFSLLRPTRVQLGLFIFALVLVAPVAVHSILYPLTSWDAKMIWMVKAKALYVEPYVPNELFESDLFESSHKDYPIGFPALVAGHYAWFGGVSEQPVALTYVAFWWSWLVLVAGALVRFAGRTVRSRRGLLFCVGISVLLLLSAGDPLFFAGLGLADMPLASAFLVATVALFGLVSAKRADRVAWWLLGLFAVLIGCNLKNEGASFAGLYVLISAVSFWLLNRSDRRSGDMGEQKKGLLLRSLTAALPVGAFLVLPLVLWRGFVSERGYRVDLFLPQDKTIQYYTERSIDVAQWFVREFTNAEHWGWALLPAILLAAGLVVCMRSQRKPLVLLAPFTLLAAQLATYIVVYVTSPHDLTWHVSTSIDRLIMQLLPAFYLLVTIGALLLIEKKRVYSTDQDELNNDGTD